MDGVRICIKDRDRSGDGFIIKQANKITTPSQYLQRDVTKVLSR